MVVLSPTGASRYNNCRMNGGTSPEYFGYTLEYNVNMIERRIVKPTPVWHPKELHVYTLTRRM
jgi:hypothetical protein